MAWKAMDSGIPVIRYACMDYQADGRSVRLLVRQAKASAMN